MKHSRVIAVFVVMLLAVLCLACAAGCGEKPCPHTDLAEHAATAPDCTHAGNPLYYTCDACGAVLDAEKQPLDEATVLSPLGHDYEEHAAVTATCTEDGVSHYYSCRRCGLLFDADKHTIANAPVLSADGHAYAWALAEDGMTATLTCTACGDEHATVHLALAEADRFLVDYDRLSDVTVRYQLDGFGEGVTVRAAKYNGAVTTDVTVSEGFVSFSAPALLAGAEMGKFDITLSLAVADVDATVDATAPITLAKVIDSAEDLLALRPTLTDGAATVTGGTVTEVDGKTVVRRNYYVLTTDISGLDRLGNAAIFGEGMNDTGAPSGRVKEGFIGILDGQGHTIGNFSMVCRGFFGHLGQATLRDITFSDISLDSPTASVLGKAMGTTLINVQIRRITVGKTRDENSGIVFFHQAYSVDMDGVTVDLTGGAVTGHIFARYLTDGDGDFGACVLRNVTVRTPYGEGIDLFEGVSLAEAPDGLTVNLVIGDDPDAGKWGEFIPTPTRSKP